MRASLVAASFGLALTSVACAYRTPAVHVPAALPAEAFDGAVQVDVLDDQRAPLPEEVADVRAWAATMLPKKSGAASTSRVTVRIDRSVAWSGGDGWEACNALCLFPVLAGMDVEADTVRVDLVVEANGRVFHGVGEATKWGSLWAPPEKRALAVALDRALANAATNEYAIE